MPAAPAHSGSAVPNVLPRSPRPGGGEQCVAGGVRGDVGVGVTLEALRLVRPVQAGQPQRSPRHEAMDVGADADPYGSGHICIMTPQVRARRWRGEHGHAGPPIQGLALRRWRAHRTRRHRHQPGRHRRPADRRAARWSRSPRSIRDLTPGSIAVPLIHLVKHLDKPLLVAGTTVGLLVLAGVAGIQFLRRPWLSYADLRGDGRSRPARGHAPVPTPGRTTSCRCWSASLTWVLLDRLADHAAGHRRRRDRRGVPAAQRARGRSAPPPRSGSASCSAAGRRRVEDARSLLRLPVTKGAVPRRRRPRRHGVPSLAHAEPGLLPDPHRDHAARDHARRVARSASTAWSTASSRSPTRTWSSASSRRPGSRSAACRTSSVAT